MDCGHRDVRGDVDPGRSHGRGEDRFAFGQLDHLGAPRNNIHPLVVLRRVLRSREYTDKAGITRRIWEVRATNLGILDRVARSNDQALPTPVCPNGGTHEPTPPEEEEC